MAGVTSALDGGGGAGAAGQHPRTSPAVVGTRDAAVDPFAWERPLATSCLENAAWQAQSPKRRFRKRRWRNNWSPVRTSYAVDRISAARSANWRRRPLASAWRWLTCSHASLSTGALGSQSLDVTDLAEWPSRFWTAGGAVRWPIFDAGRIRANIRVQDARQEQSLARYERTILQSLEEVENALVGYAKEQERRQLLIAAVQADREALELASERYTGD